MEFSAASTIAALCYARKTGLDFHDLAADLAKAMWTGRGGVRLELPTDSLAVCDMPGMRIAIARAEMGRAFPGTPAARAWPDCLLLSVGPGADKHHDIQDIVSFDQVRDALVFLVQDLEAADRVLLFEGPGAYDEEAVDGLVDELRNHLDAELNGVADAAADDAAFTDDILFDLPPTIRGEAAAVAPEAEETPLDVILDAVAKERAGGRPTASAYPPSPAPSPTQTAAARATDPTDVIAYDLSARVETELARLEAARRAYEAAEAAATRRNAPQRGFRLAMPKLFPQAAQSPVGLFMNAATARRAPADYPDYDHMPDNVDERPLLHRAAVNAMNASVLVFALPVGAALLTMSILGREDMLFSSRVTALTGTAIGLTNTGLGEKIFALFS